jgi:hypothetical protein
VDLLEEERDNGSGLHFYSLVDNSVCPIWTHRFALTN